VASLIGFISGVISGIASAVSSVLSTIVSTISSMITTVASKIAAVVKGITSAISSVAKTIASSIGSGIQAIVTGAGQVASNIASNISNLVKTIAPALADAAKEIYKSCYATARTMIEAGEHAAGAVLKYVGALGKELLLTLKNVGVTLFNTLKTITKGIYDFVKTGFNTIKKAIGGIWDFINDVIVKRIEDLVKAYEHVKGIILEKLKPIWEFYDKHIKGYVDKIAWLIHRTSEISKIVGYFKAGKVKEGILAGITLVNEKVGKEIAKVMDYLSDAIKDPFQTVGALAGLIINNIQHLNIRMRQIIGNLQEVAKNIGVKELRSVAEAIEAVRKKTLVYVDDKLRDVRAEMREISAMLTKELSETSYFIRQTLYDYHKYDYLVKFAELKKYNAITPIPYFPIINLWR